jgi:hypothetical protein
MTLSQERMYVSTAEMKLEIDLPIAAIDNSSPRKESTPGRAVLLMLLFTKNHNGGMEGRREMRK